MITLPNECYYTIFNNFHHDYKNLISCALVNRHWCRVIIPILWSKPDLKDIRVIKIFLLMLNVNEQALLIPFKITFPSHPKLLFEYTNYITSINYYLGYGIKKWLSKERIETSRELENTVKYSLIEISNQIFGIEGGKLLAKFLCKNTTLTSLNLCNNNLGSEEGKTLADVLCKNTILTSLNLVWNNLDSEVGKALADALCKNITLTSLDQKEEKHWQIFELNSNEVGPEEGKALADALCKNFTLTSLTQKEKKH
ncbi:hypothetical protein C2G38_2216148 [Gigaspora rosea]|uniref:F-box domain-containing protein n=1 Tax=Gigaspora rosea TaxID=44941 RepID=A0A397U953_9GLOM|nr:hypothetical protein C2G38_2216148 [Gigaspora rosea]